MWPFSIEHDDYVTNEHDLRFLNIAEFETPIEACQLPRHTAKTLVLIEDHSKWVLIFFNRGPLHVGVKF